MPKPYKAKLTVEIPQEYQFALRNLPHGMKRLVFVEFCRYLVELHKEEGDLAVLEIAGGIVEIKTKVGEEI
mgnify:CR=1 FL=1